MQCAPLTVFIKYIKHTFLVVAQEVDKLLTCNQNVASSIPSKTPKPRRAGCRLAWLRPLLECVCV